MKLTKTKTGDLELHVNGEYLATWEAFPITDECLDKISHMFLLVYEEGKHQQRKIIQEALGLK